MNRIISSKLREGARDLRALVAAGASEAELTAVKEAVVRTVVRIVATHLGAPPVEFDWEYYDKGGVYHKVAGLTPLQFYQGEGLLGVCVCLYGDLTDACEGVCALGGLFVLPLRLLIMCVRVHACVCMCVRVGPPSMSCVCVCVCMPPPPFLPASVRVSAYV